MLAILAQHISQGGFQTGIPGICDECFRDQTRLIDRGSQSFHIPSPCPIPHLVN